MRLSGKIALITGAGSGIGEAAACIFAREGATVLVVDRNEETAEKVHAKIKANGGVSRFYVCDISSWNNVEKTFKSIEEEFNGIDVLYNNASVFWGTKDAKID